ncbi:hypothetical protein AC579_1951 [Pseudocercospora musae]|uniref:DUF7603 domain-containing protein n=1 Tax=Pseudocercospora musae TaxID=113226 RepID=A0A139I8A4_9PEZI|nr:hypothetical protein AC579_1951 [Pseudocercospora musae]
MMNRYSQTSSLADDIYHCETTNATLHHTNSPSHFSNYSSTPGSVSARSASPAAAIAASQTHTHPQRGGATPPKKATASASLASIAVPSFSAFRSQVPDAATQYGRALPPFGNAHAAFQQKSPRAASFSQAEKGSPRLPEASQNASYRPLSLHTHTPLQTPKLPEWKLNSDETAHLEPAGHTSAIDSPATITPHAPAHVRNDSIDSFIPSSASSSYSSPRHSSIPFVAEYAQHPSASHSPQLSTSGHSIDSTEQHLPHPPGRSQSSMIHVHKTPTMTLQSDGASRRLTDEELESAGSGESEPTRPKSPGSGGGVSRFFGWTGSQKSADGASSPTTTFSERSLSPIPSPGLIKTLPLEMNGKRLSARLTPPGLDVQKANGNAAYFDNPDTPLLIGSHGSETHVQELERELSHISQELATSIRREMELEDELDRIRAEIPMHIPPSEMGRRSSDYFSDSGASSTKFPITDVDAKLEQMDKQVRHVEQEKARLTMEMASKLQTELSRRRDLEQLVQDLEDQLEKKGGSTNQVEELETALDETKRRLGQEKMTKENFEDLYSATKLELETYRNEAENLRNEVVPALKARLEGLEAEASDTQAIIYENTRLQQELAALRGNSSHSRFNSIAEEGFGNAARMSLQRSGSLARSSSLRRGGSIKDRSEGGRQRSGSVGPSYTADGVKDIEDQRDALHTALKLLIRRYERQQRDHERAVKKMAIEKSRAEDTTPKRTAYAKEVSFLKDEVSTLRKRTEDALEQKWQYEKNLSGLKMDLDRAEQETRGLRIILQDKDELSAPSASSQVGDEDDDQLRLSITRAETERDHARQVAEEYRRRAHAANDGPSGELLKLADRMDELAEELESQVQTNAKLRDRLAAAVAKGEDEQRESTRQIEDMQKRLAGMEDSVLAAQQHSETTLANHDAEVRRIEEAKSPHLQRLRISIPDSNKFAPSSPLLKKSPRVGSKKLSETSLLEVSRTQLLERKVRELEGLLREAEEDVQTVVERVNKSQMEVAELQTERDTALQQMRKLQAQMAQEREKAEGLMR